MTASRRDSPPAEGVRSLEVRWIFPGLLAAAMTGWFERFPAEVRWVEDAYLLDPYLPGLSVKVRGDRALEVKLYGGSPGLLHLAGRALGRLQYWEKSSFPHGPASYVSGSRTTWRPVNKKRRITWFSRTAGARVPGLSHDRGRAVELTEVSVRGELWWTLGFEATGPTVALRTELDAAVAAVFARPLPVDVDLGMDNCQSYAHWLRLRASAG